MVSKYLQTLKNKPSAVIFHPAIADDIYNTNKFLNQNSLAVLPQEYCSLLQLADGLSYNNIEFFGCNEHQRSKQNYTFPNLININTRYIPFDFFTQKVIIGKMSENIISFDQQNNVYSLIDRINLSTRIEIDSLPKLFQILFELRELK